MDWRHKQGTCRRNQETQKLRQETITPGRNKTYQNTHAKERKSDRRKQKTQQKYKIKTQGTADKNWNRVKFLFEGELKPMLTGCPLRSKARFKID